MKFKVWDKECGRMFHDMTIESVLEQAKEFKGEHWLAETDHVKLWSTGQTDKNGVEAHELDILKVPGDGGHKFLIAMNGGLFYGIRLNRIMPPYYNVREIIKLSEIIGNKYENPELLEPQ